LKRTPVRASACLLLIFCLTAAAQELGYWRAASNTARAITGDITLSEEKIGINFLAFPMVRVRALSDSELSAAFDADQGATGSGSLYKIDISGSRKFLHKNTLCGNEDAEWMATYVSGRSLRLAFFSSQKPPLLTIEGRTNATDLCGTYSYVK
jgi:hypothetical protein